MCSEILYLYLKVTYSQLSSDYKSMKFKLSALNMKLRASFSNINDWPTLFYQCNSAFLKNNFKNLIISLH